MWLHSLYIPSLRQDLDQIVARQEAETGEGCTLGTEIVIETLLDLLKLFVVLLELFED